MEILDSIDNPVCRPSTGLTERTVRAWHLLSLDAPTLAVVWTAFFARTEHLRLPATELVALFVAVWLLYAADRLLDTRARNGMPQGLHARHRFHRRHARGFQVAILFSSLALLPLVSSVPREDRRLDFALAALLLLWFGLIHGLKSRRALPKEVVAGLFFAAATAIPTVTRHPGDKLILPVVLFAALCILNGFFISLWEQPGSTRRLALPTGVVVLIAAAFAPAVSLAAAFLLVLDRMRPRLHPTSVRAGADLVLLSPLLVWPFLR